MELLKEEVEAKETCCPSFHPEKWEDKTFVWNKKKFIKTSVPTFLYIPLPPMIGNRITKLVKFAKDAQRLPKNREDILLLFMDPTPFRSEMYLSVTDTVPYAENTTLTGTFVSKVFDGPFNSAPKFMKQMEADLEKQGKKAKDYYVHYAYCPKCSKEAGHNYMVLFAALHKD